jgi:surface protein
MLKFGNTFVNFGGTYLSGCVDPYNPLNLPPNTVRVRTSDGNVPNYGSYDTANLVPGTSDVYDVYKSGTNFSQLLSNSKNVIEVLGANTSNVTNMDYMFFSCTSLTNVPLFDTSNVTTMHQMLYGCSNLTTVPLFDTSNVTSMRSAFAWCTNVQSGALALYQQASTQTTPPSYHDEAFTHCGSNTQTGAAELAQIPSDWK